MRCDFTEYFRATFQCQLPISHSLDMSAFIMTRLLSSALIYLRPARPLLSLTAATGRPRGQASSK